MPPLRLHECEPGVRLSVGAVEVRDHSLQVVRGRHEVGIEDDEELGVGLAAAGLQRPGLVALAIVAPPYVAVDACRRTHLGARPVDERPCVVVG